VSWRCEQEKYEQMNKQKYSKQKEMVENNVRTDRKSLELRLRKIGVRSMHSSYASDRGRHYGQGLRIRP
jgi:hypothetical protein